MFAMKVDGNTGAVLATNYSDLLPNFEHEEAHAGIVDNLAARLVVTGSAYKWDNGIGRYRQHMLIAAYRTSDLAPDPTYPPRTHMVQNAALTAGTSIVSASNYVVAGYYDYFFFGRDTRFVLVSFNRTTGALDTSFGTGGVVATDFPGIAARSHHSWRPAFGGTDIRVTGYRTAP